jgi:hypothetical protein
MQNFNCCRLSFLICLFICLHGHSQEDPNDTEFRKGWTTYLKLDNGVVSNFRAYPDLYVGGMQINPQVTVVVHRLRVGANAGFVYTNKKFSALFGPSVAFKLTSMNLKNLAGLANLQLIGEHNWGTDKQRLAGLGIGLELLQKAIVSITTHRDYKLNSWWIQAHLGIRLKKDKSTTPEFNR